MANVAESDAPFRTNLQKRRQHSPALTTAFPNACALCRVSSQALLTVLTLLLGCRSINSPAWYSNHWRGFPYQEVKEKLNDYTSVILVCVTADRSEKKEVAGATQHAEYLHHYTATIVGSYKGHYKVGDTVAFVQGYCPCGGEREVTTNTSVGELKFLLVEDKVHTDAEFGIEPCDTEPYDSKTDRLFKHIFPGHEVQQKGFQQIGCTESRNRATVPD
jgi:hypothetical protein